MFHIRRSLTLIGALALLSAILIAGCTSVGSATPGPKHIFFIMMENHATSQLIGNTADAPYINQLASQYGVGMNYYGVTHPSLPNYLALFSGDFQGIFDDCKAGASVTCPPQEFVQSSHDLNSVQLLTTDQTTKSAATLHLFTGQNLVDQLEANHLTWRAYMQSMPSAGFTGEYSPVDSDPATGNPIPRKLYAQKHNPFAYFADIANNPARVRQVVPFTSFASDLASGNVPNFVWISPDQCHDMHSLSAANAAAVGIPSCVAPASGLDHSVITLGDSFLSQTIPAIMHSPAWTKDSLIVIAWDEDDYAGYAGCCKSPVGLNHTTLGGAQAPLLVITGMGAHAIQDTTPYNHYSLLATIEHAWGLPCLANACGQPLMTQLFGGIGKRFGRYAYAP